MTSDEKWLLEEKYSGQKTKEYEEDRKRLASGEPLAYVIGWQPFLGLKIYLDSKPLIPRPETEWWTEQLLTHLAARSASISWPAREPFKFLDLCTGSGAIGCVALARFPRAQVYFGEIEPAHEATILKNIHVNGLDESRAHIRIGDLFEPFGDMCFDLVAANPPYVPNNRQLPGSVADYEPALALRAGADGLEIIRRIAQALPERLTSQGIAWIECDSKHAGAVCKVFERGGLRSEIRKDQHNQHRLVVVGG